MKIYFIGIGGIGVSALAGYFLKKGEQVSGSDLNFSENTQYLQKQGAEIFLGHKKTNIKKKFNLVIISPAVSKDNPEVIKAKELKIPIKTYPQALGELTKEYFTIAVSGTHGKSTTASMVALILTKASFDPTVIIGTKIKEFSNLNFRVGKSKYLVIEADEHFGSFLHYFPNIIVLTNIDKDHLDYYKNLDNIIKSFQKYVTKLPKNGLLIRNKKDKNSLKINSSHGIDYGLKNIKLKIPGRHNQANASAALKLAQCLKISDKISLSALKNYQGCWRRFDIRKYNKLTIVSDYAHHPKEIKETLWAAKEKFKKKKIWCVFQPHQYERTYYFFQDFIQVFQMKLQNHLIITDIFEVKGREKEKKKPVNIKELAEKSGGIYLQEKDMEKYLKDNVSESDVIIFMGAGTIYNLDKKMFPK